VTLFRRAFDRLPGVLEAGAKDSVALTDVDRDAADDALLVAAGRRVEGILANSRRTHDGRARS
jgi:hypothetical protein